MSPLREEGTTRQITVARSCRGSRARSRSASVSSAGAWATPFEWPTCCAAPAAARRPEGTEVTPYLDDERELRDYCWVVAGCVGVMLTRLFSLRDRDTSPAAERRRFELAPVVGEALQLTNILLDWPADLRRGRCHVPARWLAELGVGPRELVAGPH